MRVVKSEIPNQTKAQRLTMKWYATLINTYNVVCISFYCNGKRGEQSGDFGPEYDKAAQTIANLYQRERHQKGTAIMVKVNCSEEMKLAEMFNITYCPTFKIIKNGQPIETNSPTTLSAEHFLQFLEEHICDKDRMARYKLPDTSRILFPYYVEKLLSLEYYTSFVKEYDFVVIFFYSAALQSCKIAWPVFHEAYRELTKVYITTFKNYRSQTPEVVFVAMEAGIDKCIRKHFKIRKYPVFKCIQNGNVTIDYEGDGSVEDFVNFVKLYKGPSKHEIKLAKETNTK